MELVKPPQMEQDFSIIPVKTGKEEYLRRYSFFFFEKFPVEKYVPFDLPPEQPVFPYKRKALHYVQSYQGASNNKSYC